MSRSGQKKVTLGPEYDQATREALRRVLSSLKATSAGTSWGVAGSQEVETSDVFVGSSQLTIESETYIGLTITGDAELVDTVAGLVRDQLRGTGQS